MSIKELQACSDDTWEPLVFNQPEPYKPLAAYAVHLIDDSSWQENPCLQKRAKRAFSLLYSDKSEVCQAAMSAMQNDETLSQKLVLAKAQFEKFCRQQEASIELQRSLLEKSAKKLAAAFQVGMENKSSTNCFLNSVVQAICRIPNFRSYLKDEKEVSQELKKLFFAIYEKLQRNELVCHDEVQNFRTACTKEGFQTRGDNTQEDAQEFCNFLLPKLGFPPFIYRTAISHDVDAPIPTLDKKKGEDKKKGAQTQESKAYTIPLPLGEADQGRDIYEILSANLVKEELDAEAIFRSDSVDLKDENVLRKLELLPCEPKLINTLQAILITSAEAPEMLVVALSRFSSNLKKIDRHIAPSMKIYISCKNKVMREYELKAIVVHKGDDIEHGHYYTYATSLEAWREFNDSTVTTHPDFMLQKRTPHDPLTPHEDATCNGYLYFYQIVR